MKFNSHMQKNGKLNILHLCPDEKFIDRALDTFESAFPGQNKICAYTKKGPAKYIKRDIEYSANSTDMLLGVNKKYINKFDVLILHSLNSAWFRTIERLDINTPIIWIGWGYDYYDIIDPHNNSLLVRTREFEKNRNAKEKRKKGIKQRIQDLLNSKNRVRRLIERIDYFSPVIATEYDVLKHVGNWKSFPKLARWNYAPAECELSTYVRNVQESNFTKENILVGNSATSTNNHLEAFDLLKKIGFNYREIVVPLSYGDLSYSVDLRNIGEVLLGGNFSPLIDFMAPIEYMKKINQCGFVIMNHVRQQAVGNIIIMLYLGAKVFLREENPTYKYFKSIGMILFTIQELSENHDHLNVGLSDGDVQLNRNILDSIWSSKALVEKTYKLLEPIINKREQI
ncbi:MAG: TDP-N-acetylfucosamine:lipid II N-acetylfucosaminyltransferase [Serratia sp. (in: enterobacteria)]|uniref:TDP-N-acetylfucosamine:lipid II N-acetylfucosaminyltransferase n=1 Tax=Serratia sp. (in: enterobacteria) TaxID=616 RepID=UPI003F355996